MRILPACTATLLLLSAVLLAPPTARADDIDEAKELLGGPKHAEAVAKIRKAIAALEKQPNDADAIRRAGVGYFFLEDDAKSRAALTRAIKLAPKDRKAWYWLGVLWKYSDLAEAEKAMAKAVSLAPGHAIYLFELADIQRYRKRSAEAIATYKKALAVEETHAGAHQSLGILLTHTAAKDEAVKHLERALELDESLLLARYNVGLQHYLVGRFAKARAHWQAGAKQAPDDFGMHKKLIQAHYALGQYAEASVVRKRLLAIRAKLEKKPKEFCFDQFAMGTSRIMAFEQFDTSGDLVYLYVFRVVGADGKITRRVNLETNAVAKELGGGWVLGITENDGSHTTLGPWWKKIPPYPALKEQVILAAQGKLKPGVILKRKPKR